MKAPDPGIGAAANANAGAGATAGDHRRITLPAGTLDITTGAGDLPLDRLCDFAARNNPRRGFLIVSRVLGRHLPATPAEMQLSFDSLAARIAPALPGPVVFIGLAETAICLGQGVYAAWRARSRRRDSLYLHSTRQRIDAELMAGFDEPHSHASAHLLYRPVSPAHRDLLAAARSLVIVDDEISTGTTLANLAAAMAPNLPRLEQVIAATLVDWSADQRWLTAMPAPATTARLLGGQLVWTPAPGYTATADITPAAAASLGSLPDAVNFGRTGITDDPPGLTARIAAEAAALDARHGPGQRFLVLGTGEFTWVPFRLARALAARGHQVHVQATTRSPIHLGGAIATSLTFADNYATGVPNYLYNVQPDPRVRVVIAHETPAGSIDPRLVETLAATTIGFGA